MESSWSAPLQQGPPGPDPHDPVAQEMAAKFFLEEYKAMRTELVAEHTMQSQHSVALLASTAAMVLLTYQLVSSQNKAYLQTGLLVGSSILGTLAWAAERHGLTGWLIAQYLMDDLTPLVRRTLQSTLGRDLASHMIGWEDFAKNATQLRIQPNARFLFGLMFITNQLLRRLFFILPATLALGAALLMPTGTLRLPVSWWEWGFVGLDVIIVASYGIRLFINLAFYRGLGQ
jgi:hypothetical protein